MKLLQTNVTIATRERRKRKYNAIISFTNSWMEWEVSYSRERFKWALKSTNDYQSSNNNNKKLRFINLLHQIGNLETVFSTLFIDNIQTN